MGSGRQAVRGDLGAGRAGLRGRGRAERAKRETKRAVLSETGRGGAGPVSRALGRALGPSELGRWELGRAERVFGFSGFGLSF